MNFDPKAAKELYSQKEDEELVRIALLELDYLPEARRLAEEELGDRGVSESDRRRILKLLKADDADAEQQRWEDSSFVYDIRSPLLNLSFQRKRMIAGFLGALTGISIFSFQFEWDLFFGYDRWVAALGTLVFLVFVYRVGPTGKELREHFRNEKAQEDREG